MVFNTTVSHRFMQLFVIFSLRSRRFRSSVKWETRSAYIHLLISDKTRGEGNTGAPNESIVQNHLNIAC